MHDLDRQQLEQYEAMASLGGSGLGELGLELSEQQELALASELLEVASEEELEEFLGALWERTKAAASRAYNSPAVQGAIPAVKTAGRYMLPALAGTVADRFYPGTGTMVSAGAQMLADQLLKEELEGLSAEDREFETARRFVRFANAAMQQAARAPERVPPQGAAQIAVRDAARTQIPGLVPFVAQLFGAAQRGAGQSNESESGMSAFGTHETGYESGPFETMEAFEGPFEAYEGSQESFESEDEQFLGGLLGALTGEAEGETPLNETQEMELAAELLEIANEEELEEFLGNLVKGVAKGVGGFIRSPVGRQLGGILKGVAKKALPVVGGALGSIVAPGVGTALGSKLGSMASQLFEIQSEGMDREQLEFEVARRVVRLAATSAKQAALAPPNAPPKRVAQAAVAQAARRHAPGLLRGTRGYGPRGQGQRTPRASGRPRRRRGAPLGAAAFPVGGSTVFVPGGDSQAAAQRPSYGPPEWADGQDDDDGSDRGGQYGRPRSGRWYRRGRRIVLVDA